MDRRCQRHGPARNSARHVATEHRLNRKQRFQHRPPLFVNRRVRFRNEIENDECAASEIVPPFKSFAVGPHEAATGEIRQRCERGPETVRDGEQRAVPIPHRPGRRVNECAPAIQLRLRRPKSALGWSQRETSALNRPRRERQQRWGRNGVGASVLEGPDSAFITRIWPSISAPRVEGLALVSASRTAFDFNKRNAHRLIASGRLRSAATAQRSGRSSKRPG